MADIVTVRLVRHAPTKENLEKRYIGWTDAKLHDPSCLAIIDEFVTTVFGSDLCRCRQTANGYFPNAQYVPNPDFREMNFGDFEGKTYEQLKDNSRYCAWLDDSIHHSPPNGEKFNTFRDRVLQGFQALSKTEKSFTLVVHGGVIRILLMYFAPESKPFWSWQAPHDMIYTLTWSRQEWEEGARCMSLSVAPIMANTNM
ncbi:MAG: histidine phosphatase family protein [Lysinibacillus sp.]